MPLISALILKEKLQANRAILPSVEHATTSRGPPAQNSPIAEWDGHRTGRDHDINLHRPRGDCNSPEGNDGRARRSPLASDQFQVGPCWIGPAISERYPGEFRRDIIDPEWDTARARYSRGEDAVYIVEAQEGVVLGVSSA